MKDQTMQRAMDEFISNRINVCGVNESESLQEACEEFKTEAVNLRDSLSQEQKALFIKCENAYGLVDGETRECYYRAGFSDAVLFLLGWRDGEWK